VKRWLILVAAALAATSSASGGASAVLHWASLGEVSDAITELDVARAEQLLHDVPADDPAFAFERARLRIYQGDCDTAEAMLSAPSLRNQPDGASLYELAKTCAGATAGSVVVEDTAHGLWIRLQDDEDRALVPWIVSVADRARSTLERDLGVVLPRPLHIDLVRDLFSLSAVCGLPVEAAETTGTVAIARWGRVTMISPRATPHGFPWEDTLAHEMTHLALSRATRDRAPLWFQEGVAKREESRWRTAGPFDDPRAADRAARAALLNGTSVGIDRLGPSIAMLPSADAAATAFAEVTSFIDYWIDRNGAPAFRLLLADLKGVGNRGADAALRSVSGYTLSEWKLMWEHDLREHVVAPARAVSERQAPPPPPGIQIVREVRLGGLLADRGHAAPAAERFGRAVQVAPTDAPLRWQWARSRSDARDAEAGTALGEVGDADGPCAGWFALKARFVKQSGDRDRARVLDELGVAFDPLLEDVACEGQWRSPANPTQSGPLPDEPARRDLCLAARRVVR
jgi:hypothetical protein